MTERRPPGLSTGDWIDAQIRRAQEEGAFDDLAGTGKPIPDLLAPETDLDYVAKIARREGLEATAFLPPALALAKEVEDLPERLAREVMESRVREHLDDLNARIVKAIRAPQTGPPPLGSKWRYRLMRAVAERINVPSGSIYDAS